MSTADRILRWPGAANARDLGGLPTRDGGRTRRGAIVRSGSLATLEARGWSALEAYGVRTIVDLRNEKEIGADRAPRPASVETLNIPLDVSEDREFWGRWESGPEFGTPLYYGPHLQRHPDRSAAVVAAIARAKPGGVVFHCAGGRDRSGQIAMLILTLVGVAPELVAADYALSVERPRPGAQPDPDLSPDEFLRQRGTTAPQVLRETLAGLDAEATLLAAGLTAEDLSALRARLA